MFQTEIYSFRIFIRSLCYFSFLSSPDQFVVFSSILLITRSTRTCRCHAKWSSIFVVVKNPYDLRSQIRFWILPQKRTPSFFIGSYVIANTEEIKPLGVSSDKELHFSKHIADIVRKVGNQIKVLQRHKNVTDVYAKMRLYNGYL